MWLTHRRTANWEHLGLRCRNLASGPVFFHGPWAGCVVCRGNAVSAVVLLIDLSLSGKSGQSSWLWFFGMLGWRPLRLAKLMFQKEIVKTKVFLGFSKLREGKEQPHLFLLACLPPCLPAWLNDWMNEWMDSGECEILTCQTLVVVPSPYSFWTCLNSCRLTSCGIFPVPGRFGLRRCGLAGSWLTCSRKWCSALHRY